MTEKYRRAWQQELLEQTEIALREVRATGKSKGILVIGETGVGKTHAFDELAQLYPPRQNGLQRLVPLVRLSIATGSTWDSNIRAILKQLGRPSETIKRGKLLSVLLAASTATELEIGAMEEFHNAVLSVTPTLGKQNSQFLKDFWNFHDPANPRSWTSPLAGERSKGVVLVVSGTPALEAPFLSDGELASRFNIVVRAKPPALFPQSALQDFQMLVKALRDRFGLPKELSPNDFELLARLYFATAAHLRLLAALFERTASLLQVDGQLSWQNALAIAFRQVIPPRAGGIADPFGLTGQEISELVKREQLRFKSLQQ